MFNAYYQPLSSKIFPFSLKDTGRKGSPKYRVYIYCYQMFVTSGLPTTESNRNFYLPGRKYIVYIILCFQTFLRAFFFSNLTQSSTRFGRNGIKTKKEAGMQFSF